MVEAINVGGGGGIDGCSIAEMARVVVVLAAIVAAMAMVAEMTRRWY